MSSFFEARAKYPLLGSEYSELHQYSLDVFSERNIYIGSAGGEFFEHF